MTPATRETRTEPLTPSSSSDSRGRPLHLDTWRRGRLYFTSDWHLGHERIIHLCDRPFGSVVEMNETIIARTNEVVSYRDTLVILGDLALGRLDETLRLLGRVAAGRIWVLPGNHDRFSLGYGHHGAPETLKIKRRLWIDQYQAIRSGVHCEPDRLPSAWPAEVAGRGVLLSHYPYAGGGDPREQREGEDRYRALRPVDRGLPLIHGHVHGRWQQLGRMFNVGVDVNDFRPVSEDRLARWLMTVPVQERAV